MSQPPPENSGADGGNDGAGGGAGGGKDGGKDGAGGGGDFGKFGLDAQLLEALARLEFTTPTPIQNLAIPPLLDGHDLVGLAQTGTGKTAAFLLPLLDHLLKAKPTRAGAPPTSLILAPTRELAMQIRENLRQFAMDLNLRHTAIFGGARYDPQIRDLKRGMDIVVATPGRLEDLAERKVMQFDRITHFILDEADHMLDLGFYPAMKRIAAALPTPRQTMLFSATMPPQIQKLTKQFLKNPIEVKAPESEGAAKQIQQQVLKIEESAKRGALVEILRTHEQEQLLVFIRTKRRADALARALQKKGFAVDALHGDMRQNTRQKVLNQFRKGKLQALIATDVAARGIDVAGIGLVINFDPADTKEAHTHRIGRTGRAGLTGKAITFEPPSAKPKHPPTKTHKPEHKKPKKKLIAKGNKAKTGAKKKAKGKNKAGGFGRLKRSVSEKTAGKKKE